MTKMPAAVLLLVTACSDDPSESCYPATVQASRCDPALATFSLASTNRYYPLRVGSEVVIEGVDEGATIRVERRVLSETQVVMGVTTHVLEAKELVDGELYEVARNFYVEAADGTVCYFGEDVSFYENGVVANHDGSWRAGEGDAMPGVIMPSAPSVGDAYFQENAPGVARDMGRIASTTESLAFDGVTHDDVVMIMDTNPLESCADEEPKLYIPGIGESADTVKTITSFVPGA